MIQRGVDPAVADDRLLVRRSYTQALAAAVTWSWSVGHPHG